MYSQKNMHYVYNLAIFIHLFHPFEKEVQKKAPREDFAAFTALSFISA